MFDRFIAEVFSAGIVLGIVICFMGWVLWHFILSHIHIVWN